MHWLLSLAIICITSIFQEKEILIQGCLQWLLVPLTLTRFLAMRKRSLYGKDQLNWATSEPSMNACAGEWGWPMSHCHQRRLWLIGGLGLTVNWLQSVKWCTSCSFSTISSDVDRTWIASNEMSDWCSAIDSNLNVSYHHCSEEFWVRCYVNCNGK